MHEFHLPDMTCGHCASKVNVILKLVDPACEIQLDLPRQLVSVKSAEDREALVEALSEAGYPPR
ncbi:heavy-metal-associated domain-containing protein [Hydrogenophaga taeniospiralis]|uniref:heavy-metal-associated domain-containing protein n=1 Tax=Hydrogenophaga taeniospiralis TaxID=65656 RepID=UPI001CFA5325|nr:heavy-metal-associated domain-containing protein [Hydrogenophaga taeniospiralis]UCU93463.1 heavy-metal-associated domain-containing protein [Hydrogenophaga taeniospiralis]